MATMPPQSPAAAPDDGATDTDSSALFVIEIYALQDGTFSVECESGSQESGEESGGGEPDESSEGAQTAKDWAGAVEIANQMYQDQSGSNAPAKQAGFDSVFGSKPA